jgi:CubicO group peptidase (beta-lactamase class C family)
MTRRIAAFPALVLAATLLPSPATHSSPGAVDSGPGRWRTLAGEPRDAAMADRVLARLMVEHGLGALSVAIVQDHRIVYSAVRGEVRPGRAAGPDTVFRGASLSKPVFAYLVLQLVDQGILDLDSPIDTFLPRPLDAYEHYRALAADPRHSALTVRRLLSQQSGLPNWHREGPVPFIADPGTRFGYSGEGYALLQLVLEERTGRAVSDLAREYVFEPLGMSRSSFLWEGRFDGEFAVDLGAGLGPLILQSRERANVAGSLISNASDYARFLQAVMDGSGLSAVAHAAMLEPQVRISSRSIFSPPASDPGPAPAMDLAWTAGWGRFVSPHGPAIFHLGREEGCEAYAVAFLEPQTALVAMAVSPLRSTFTAPLAAALIGDTRSPLEWLEYGRTVDASAPARVAFVAAVVVLTGAAVVLSVLYLRLRRQRMAVRSGIGRR